MSLVLRGILKCINNSTCELETVLFGHGNAVNDLRLHPIDDALIFSASKDESIRLWNLRTAVCIAIFAGERGHRDEVLSIDVHPLGHCFVSSGMDTNVKIWNLSESSIEKSIDKSFDFVLSEDALHFKPHLQPIPIYSTNQVHSDYVDSVRWFGNCLVTKSTKNRIVIWSPDSHRYKVR